MPRYVATVSGAGVHAIKDMVNYVDEQRKEKKHGLASDSPR